MPFTRRILVWFALLLPLFYLSIILSNAYAAVADNTVETIGVADASVPNARQVALKNAFRQAIEQVVGIQLSSETIVQNAAVLTDEIYTYSEGFIEDWEISKEEVKDGLLTLHVQAVVREGRLNKSLFMNGLPVNKIYAWMGEPRVLLLMQEYVDNQLAQTDLAQTNIENAFIEKGIHVFDQAQLANIQERDRQLAFNDAVKAVTMGKRLGAEIVISGKCIANFSRQLTIGQFTVNFYSAVTQIRAYNTATGQLILSESYTSDPAQDTSAIGKFDAAVNAIKSNLSVAQEDMLYKILRNWYDAFSQPTVYSLMVEGIDYQQLQALKTSLHGLNGFVSLQERAFCNNTAELEVKYESLSGRLTDAVIAAGLPYEITRTEQQRIFLRRNRP